MWTQWSKPYFCVESYEVRNQENINYDGYQSNLSERICLMPMTEVGFLDIKVKCQTCLWMSPLAQLTLFYFSRGCEDSFKKPYFCVEINEQKQIMMDTKVRTESTMSCQSWMVGKSWWVAQSTLHIKRRPTFCSMVFGGVTYLMPNMSLQPSNKLFVHSSPLIQISVLVTRFHILYTVQWMACFLITLECPKHTKRNWLRGDVP